MSEKRKIEIFSAGCPACVDAIALVRENACPTCYIEVLDMNDEEVAARARELGVRSAPAVVIDGVLASCCEGRGPDLAALQGAGLGSSRT